MKECKSRNGREVTAIVLSVPGIVPGALHIFSFMPHNGPVGEVELTIFYG